MKQRVVVTGMGCVSPLGNDAASTWAGISQGRSGIGRITRFDPSELRSQMAGEVKRFDTTGVIDPKELKKMDVFIQYALVAAQEAIKDSGLEINEALARQVGVSVGVGFGGIQSFEKYHGLMLAEGPRKVSPFFVPMILGNMAAGHISIQHNCRGYNASTVSACSSSNHSMGDAMRIIQLGQAKAMIVGGAEAVVSPLIQAGFSAMRALSTRNHDPATASRPYDINRDGFVVGEGAAILVLEEMEFAKARGARMYGELVGYGFSADAHHITTPTQEGPAQAMAMALADAKMNPEQVDYLNTHGTSTGIGDLNELAAIQQVWGQASGNLSLSSTKSMTGHLLGAAGAIEAVVCLKAMQQGLVPPTAHIEELDPACTLDVTPNRAKERKIQVAVSNSFGFGGTNATVVFRAV
ncbi:MAG: beta-ketoacyl-ACP synthase II [Deltaproteobacteria bacterium]|nr:beta-ketoacyl-ACP synthase II [Deltaproteobacteria bacterium]